MKIMKLAVAFVVTVFSLAGPAYAYEVVKSHTGSTGPIGLSVGDTLTYQGTRTVRYVGLNTDRGHEFEEVGGKGTTFYIRDGNISHSHSRSKGFISREPVNMVRLNGPAAYRMTYANAKGFRREAKCDRTGEGLAATKVVCTDVPLESGAGNTVTVTIDLRGGVPVRREKRSHANASSELVSWTVFGIPSTVVVSLEE